MKKINILVVDDSAFNRRTLTKMLEDDPVINVVGTAFDGQNAIKKILKFKPDLITLDLEMPGMDGFAALRWIMDSHPLPVLVVSARGDDKSVFSALELGAVDFLVKPTARASLELEEIRNDLIEKIYAISKLDITKVKEKAEHFHEKATPSQNIDLLKQVGCDGQAEVVLIGSSTGGPSALQNILTKLPKDLPVPILIAQHMPPVFTSLFAQRLDKNCNLRIKEAMNGETIKRGHVYIAPGGKQMTVFKKNKDYHLKIVPKKRGEKYSPSVDRLFLSAAQEMGKNKKLLAVILTGMGNDGKEGMKAVREVNGLGLAESLSSAIITSMPEEVIKAGLVDGSYDLENMAEQIVKRCAKIPG